MTIPHAVRASDHPEILRASREDFIVRKPPSFIKRGYQLSLMAAFVAVSVAALVLNDALMVSLVCVLVGTIMLILARRIEKLQAMLVATEFSNALFTSAMGKGYAFTAVAARNGEIIYLDRSFQEMFPHFIDQPRRTLDLLLTTHNAPPEQCQYIASLVAQPSRAEVPLSIAGGPENAMHEIMLAIDPIERPRGFVLLRGRRA